MMNMTLHMWTNEIDLGRTEKEEMWVLAKDEFSTKWRAFKILDIVMIQAESWAPLSWKYLLSKERMI